MRASRLAQYSAALVFIGFLFYLPLVGIFAFGFSSEFSTLGDPDFWSGGFASKLASTLWFTVWQATTSTLLVVVTGMPIAYLLYRKRFAGQRAIRVLITVPFILPILVIAIAFSTFRKLNTGIAAVDAVITNPVFLIISAHVFINLALVVRTVGSTWLGLADSLDEAAALDGAGRLRTFWSVTLAQLTPSVVASATLVFAYTSASFAVVLVLGGGLVQSLETSIYESALIYLDLGKAAVLALCQLLLTALAFWLADAFGKQARIDFADSESGFDTDNHAAGHSTRKPVDKRDLPAIGFGLVIALFFVLPIWNVFQQAFTYGNTFSFTNFYNLLSGGSSGLLDISLGQALGNSVRNTIIATVASLLIGVAVAWLLVHTKRGLFNRILDFAYLAPIGVSTVLLGLGYLVTFSQEPFALRASWFVVPLVETLLALPLVVRMVYSALAGIERVLLDAARLDGANSAKLFWQIELPLIRPTIEVAAGFAAIIALGDFGASAFLAFGDQETLPLVLFRLFSHPGASNYGMAMAMSALLIVVTALTLLAVSLRTTRSIQR